MQQLEAHEFPLHRVLSSDFDLEIPRYQRQYSWQPEQAIQLLQDVTEALDRDDDEPYFLGTVVLVKQKDKSQAQVIDGQQRLTTLTNLLAVMRDLTTDGELRLNLEEMISEPGNKIQALQPKPCLALRPRDREFFGKNVQASGMIAGLIAQQKGTGATDAQEAIRNDAKAFWEALTEWSEERRFALTSMQRSLLALLAKEWSLAA